MKLLLIFECPSVDYFPSYGPVTIDGEAVPPYLPMRSTEIAELSILKDWILTLTSYVTQMNWVISLKCCKNMIFMLPDLSCYIQILYFVGL